MKRILLVDANPDTLKKVSGLLNSHSNVIEVLTATNGREAIAIIEQRKISMLITSLKMPVMDGFELLAYLNKHHPRLKSVVMLDDLSPLARARIRNLGAKNMLDQPVDIGALTEKIFTELQISYGGKVRGLSLPSFLQMLEMEQKTCRLKITDRNRSGYLYLNKGTLMAAECDGSDKDQAALEILSWRNATIEIDYIPHTRKKEITQSLMNILMESQRRIDEKQMDVKGLSMSQRKAPRSPCLVAVEYDPRGMTCRNNLRNISLTGAYVESADPVSVGQEVQITLNVPHLKQACDLTGVVVRTDDMGMGIKFKMLTPVQQNIVKILVQGLKKGQATGTNALAQVSQN